MRTNPPKAPAPMDRRIFATYVEKELAPTLDKGEIVIMDNLAAHKSKARREGHQGQGCMDPVPAAL
jgi:hypothetical protein